MSTGADYTSWTSLTDKTWLGRSIPPAEPRDDLPSVKEVTKLFVPRPEGQRQCPKSTLLFPVFAQYLTDGFLRTDMKDRRKTTSNHDIDLSPLYGRTPVQTRVLGLIEGRSFPRRSTRLAPTTSIRTSSTSTARICSIPRWACATAGSGASICAATSSR
jgi:hypothetical protein